MGVTSIPIYDAAGFRVGHYLYLLFCVQGSDIYVKVGISKNPLKRLQLIVQGLPFLPTKFSFCSLPNVEAAAQVERNLLHRFESRVSRGEWLKLTADDAPEFRSVSTSMLQPYATPSKPIRWRNIDPTAYAKQMDENRRAAMALHWRRQQRRGASARAHEDFKRHSREA